MSTHSGLALELVTYLAFRVYEDICFSKAPFHFTFSIQIRITVTFYHQANLNNNSVYLSLAF